MSLIVEFVFFFAGLFCLGSLFYRVCQEGDWDDEIYD